MIVEVIGEVLMPKFLSIIINRATEGNLYIGSSIGVGLLMILTAVLMMLGGIGGAYFGAKASVNFATDLRFDAFSKLQRFSFKNIDNFSTGSIVTRLTNDVQQMQNFVNMLLRMALRSPGMMIGGLIMAISLRPSIGVVFAVTMPLMIISILVLILLSFPRFNKMQTKIDALNSTVQENVTNVRVVKSFVREEYEKDKFHRANTDLKVTGLRALKIMIYIMPIMNLFMYGTTIAVIWFGHDIVITEGMPVGDLSALITYVSQILISLMMITMLLMNTSRALASAKRISAILDEKLDLSDDGAEYKDLTVQNGEIEFKNVSFRYYKNSEDKVLDAINLKIKSGSTVGIIGSTGCGKTTLVSMIPRLYDVDEGEVLIDGINVRDYSLYNLREGVGMVLQKNVLFSGSIRENLLWGDANAENFEIEAASKSAAADKFVSTFKDGYDTMLEKGGVNVSGGQKQRLCIARALLKKPKILILDDSTSAVDTVTERQIREALRNTLPATTKIIIAQRISSVMDADMIIVMDDGKITGIGTHEELMDKNLAYQEIYSSQMESAKGVR
jgi:ATP-binding cassette subfamily B protein